MSSLRRKGFTLVELLVVITIIGMLVAWLVPAVNVAREAGRRATCISNQKELATAVNQYAAARDRYPNLVNPETGRNWVVAVLEYLCRNDLAKAFRRNGLGAVKEVKIGQLICLSDEPDERDAPALTYAGSPRVFESVDGSFPNSRSPSSIGALTVTPMISERKFTDPENPRMWYDGNREKLSFNPEVGRMIGDEDILRSQHPGGTVVAFCDGSVKFLANDWQFGEDGTVWEPKEEQ